MFYDRIYASTVLSRTGKVYSPFDDIEFYGKLLASQNRGMEFKESILRIQVFMLFFLAIVCGAHNVFCCNQTYIGVVFLLLCTFFLYFFFRIAVNFSLK